MVGLGKHFSFINYYKVIQKHENVHLRDQFDKGLLKWSLRLRLSPQAPVEGGQEPAPRQALQHVFHLGEQLLVRWPHCRELPERAGHRRYSGTQVLAHKVFRYSGTPGVRYSGSKVFRNLGTQVFRTQVLRYLSI